MNKSVQRNGAIDFWKFAFSILIVICHLEIMPSFAHDRVIWFKSASIGVEFFFIVSGFLMAKHTRDEGMTAGKATWEFIKSKYLGIIPMYLFAYFVSLTVKAALGDDLLKLFGGSIFELLFLHNAGLSQLFGARFFVVQATWYISAMLLSMFVLYPILHSHRDMFLNVVAPLLCIFIMGYFAKYEKTLKFMDGFFSIMRAAAEICLGCIAYRVCEVLKKHQIAKATGVMLTIIECSCYISIFVTAFFIGRGMYDFIAVIILAMGVAISFSGKSYSGIIFRGVLCKFLGKLSLAIYLNHVIVIYLFQDFNMPLSVTTEVILVFALTIALSLICVFVTDIIQILIKKRKQLKMAVTDNV
ncbi:MAG: acyltransferase [Oscillospiraceae bacterium]|nr:acyltransferase [Oscillospiraceae bacterium]